MTNAFLASFRPWAAPLVGAIALIGCSYAKPNTTPPNFSGIGSAGDITANRAGGEDSGILFTYPKRRTTRPGDIAINPYLWRGALLTVGSVPLVSADPFGGVIITDWYGLADAPGERFKENVFIFSRSLRSDAVRVNVFRQVYRDGRWFDAQVSPDMPIGIQNQIIQEARRLQASGRR